MINKLIRNTIMVAALMTGSQNLSAALDANLTLGFEVLPSLAVAWTGAGDNSPILNNGDLAVVLETGRTNRVWLSFVGGGPMGVEILVEQTSARPTSGHGKSIYMSKEDGSSDPSLDNDFIRIFVNAGDPVISMPDQTTLINAGLTLVGPLQLALDTMDFASPNNIVFDIKTSAAIPQNEPVNLPFTFDFLQASVDVADPAKYEASLMATITAQ